MTKKTFFILTTIPILGYILLPVLFQNIPLPGLWFGSLVLYISGLLIVEPKIFLAKEFIAIYCLCLIYFFLVPYTVNSEEHDWLLRRIVPLFVGVSLYTYFFKYTYDPKGLRVIFWMVFIFIIITCITTLNGLSMHPEASRQLAGTVGGDTEITSYYQGLGIAGYGFISALAYWVPIIVLFFKQETQSTRKLIWLSIILLLLYTVLKAQYTTQLGLFVLAMILSFSGNLLLTKYKLLIIFVGIALLVIPSSVYADFANYIASILDSEILSSRLSDFAETISNDGYYDEDTHTGRRVDRIPFLLLEFIKSPIIGGGQSTGHVFWLDHLSLYGILGAIPWFYLLISIYNRIKVLITNKFFYFQIAFLVFLLLGFFKGSGSREQFVVLFFTLPVGLFLTQLNEQQNLYN